MKIESRTEYKKVAAKVEALIKEGKACKNSFKRQCIAQEVIRLQAKLQQFNDEFEELDGDI